MARKKVEVNNAAEEAVEEVKVETKATRDFPEVAGTGRFQAVEFNDGYVVYNPAGQRASEVLSLDKANDIVRANNIAAHIK